MGFVIVADSKPPGIKAIGVFLDINVLKVCLSAESGLPIILDRTRKYGELYNDDAKQNVNCFNSSRANKIDQPMQNMPWGWTAKSILGGVVSLDRSFSYVKEQFLKYTVEPLAMKERNEGECGHGTM